jgi:hypothetical protein
MDDDAVLSCTPLAELLFVRMLAVAGQLKTDGYLTRAQIVHRAGARLGEAKVPKLLAELVSAGPVVESDGGYRIRAWLEWNASAEELQRDRARDAERKRAERAGLRPDDPPPPPSVQAESGRTDDGIQTDSDRSPPGIHVESNGSPPRVRRESRRSPASRAPTRPGHGTVLNGTTPSEPTVPPNGAKSNAAKPLTAQDLTGEWIDSCQARPPGAVVGQVAKHVGTMLAEKIPPDMIRSGLTAWQARGQSPSSLPSFVHAAQNGTGTIGYAGNTYGEPPATWIEQAKRVVAAFADAAGMPGPECRAPAVKAAHEMCAEARGNRWRIPEPLLAVARDGAA